MKKIYNHISMRGLLVMAGLLVAFCGWGQAVTGNQYTNATNDGHDVSVNITSVSGSSQANGHVADYAIDTDNNSYWQSGNTDENPTLTLQVPEGNAITRLEITSTYNYNSNNRPASVTIRSRNSTDEYWTMVLSDRNWSNGSTLTIENLSINDQYIQIEFERSYTREWSGDYWNGHWEYTYHPVRIYDIEMSYHDLNLPSIQHKPAKWHAQRTGGNFVDDFRGDKMFTKKDYDDSYGLSWPTDASWQGIQAAHTLVDTIYVEKGSMVTLALPDRRDGIDGSNPAANIGSYQRWYNFRTESSFRTNDNNVIDLLTPLTEGEKPYYRFVNGYVNRPLTPWRDEGRTPSRMQFYYPEDTETDYFPLGQSDNSFYLVACDLSGYTDFSSDGSTPNSNDDYSVENFFVENNYYEPTLTHRVIYYLVGVESGNRPVEEYEIDFPAYTLPNKSNEMVALPKDARSYLAGTGDNQLTVTIPGNTNNAGISLVPNNSEDYAESVGTVSSITLGGDRRSIFFRMPNHNDSDGSRYVNNLSQNPTSIIEVEAGGNVVVRFKLTFRNESRLLTQTMVNRLDANYQLIGKTWGGLRYRTPDSLSREHNLLTELNFDYEVSIATGRDRLFYPFPLAWESSTYGFYDGTNNSGFIGGGARNYYYPEYGSYSLLRADDGYVEYGSWAWGLNSGFTKKSKPNVILENSEEESSTYHLFVDASDRPGLIARLPFEEDLCAGSVLYVSAWVKTARWDNSSDNAAVLFTIMGVDAEGKYTPIYRHQTGQIPATYGGMNSHRLNLPGLSDNEWMQTYFSFVNSSNQDFDYYVLQIDNNSPSTQGGDIYLDDIRVYVARPMAKVTQLQMACTDSRTLMNLKIDWDRFCQRIDVSNPNGNGDLGICFVDTLIFHNVYEETKNLEQALDEAVVELGQDETNSRKFRMLHYHNTFSDHQEYIKDKPDGNVAADNEYYFYRLTEEDGSEYLSVDFYGDMVPNRAYWVVMVTGDIAADEETSEITNTDIFTYFYTDPCALVADFKVQGDAIIKVNGEIFTPETEFCRGNVHNFTVDLRVPVEDKYVTVTEGIYYDWFFGTTNDPLTEYQTVNSAYGVSLQEALRVFRNIYPDAANLDDVVYGDNVQDDTDAVFTEGMYNIINHYLTMNGPEEGLNRPLVLRQPSLSITLLEALRVVVCPIPTKVPPEGLGLTEQEWKEANICWGYTYLELTTTNDAPTLHAGFNTTSYPDEGYDPALRIGLQQIKDVFTERSVLIVNLRGAKSYDPDNKRSATLRRVRKENGSVDEQYAKIYLTHSTDPAMQEWLSSPNYHELALPIGTLEQLEAHYYQSGTTTATNEMQIRFDLSTQTIQWGEENKSFIFVPKEGYEYTFSVYYEEMVDGQEDIGTACIGTFPVTMKVVPEYLVWDDKQKNDTQIGNWNNDGNWRRATNGELKKSGNSEGYPTEGNTSGYVPMLFSKVIMPRDSKVLLYAAGLQRNESGNNNEWVSNRPEYVAAPTDSIQYDLMAYELNNALTTQPYRVSLLDEIHFEPGAEMLHAEYLLYNKAWIDYELDKGNWYTLASPLQGVVAGDFYADSDNGVEKQEYFTDITFSANNYNNGNIANNRFKPSVYQRAWKGSATLQTLNSGTPDVAISGNWSSLYNDVDEAYTPGTGFSLKVQDIEDNTLALFRLPKADGSYSYYSYDGSESGHTTTITEEMREGAGKLITDGLYLRNTNYSEAGPGSPIEVQLTETANGDYYLVGNPFMAHLNMKAFFENTNNGSVLEPKYWYAEDGEQNIAVTDPDDPNTWTTSEQAGLIPPLRSFFVKKKEDSGTTGNITIYFTADMQALAPVSTSEGEASGQALLITAQTQDGRTSRAAVAYNAMASDDYQSAEDAELFLDSNLGDVPMVYTVAGTMATSINVRTACERVPLGVYGARNEQVTLRFDQVGVFSGVKLYDTKTKSYTTLTDGSEVSVSTNDYGRYYLTGGIATGNEAIRSVDDISIYSVRSGEIVATSAGSSLRSVRVYGIGGELVAQQSLANQSVYRLRVPGNAIYVVYAEDMDGIIRNVKLRVR